jgi:hypothetical protein
MRIAIADQLKTITGFGNRVFQAFTAPSNTTTPYCTFKIAEDDPSVNNKSGSLTNLQVFIFVNPATFSLIDTLALEVRKKLHNVMLTIDDSPDRYFTAEYIRSQPDVPEEITGLFSKRVDFIIPMARP